MTATPTELPDSMRASVLHPDLSITTDELPVPALDADEVLVQVGAVGVCGSDVHYWKHGRIADFVVDTDIILGHELGGRIVAVGAGVDEARIGQRVAVEPQRSCRVCEYCKSGRYNLCPKMEFYATPPIDGGFCEYVTIQADYAHPIPDEVSDDAAAMLEPLSVGIAAARKADLRPGQSVFIAGAGPIGIIQCQVARAFGAARIIVSDPAQPRRELALQHGATDVVDPTATDVSTAGYNVDAFIDCAGVAPAVVSGMHTVKPGGHVVLVGMGADEIALPIPLIQNYELIVTGIFRYTDTYPLGIHFVASGKVDLDALVTSSYGLDEAQTALGRAGAPDELKVVVRPGGVAPAMLSAERDAVADACRRLRREGLVVGTAGNVSVRVGDLVVISPSGVDYDELTGADVGVHALDGTAVETTLAPSSELPLHLAVYADTEHRAVVHTHAPHSTALSTLVDEVPPGHYYTAMFGGPVRVAPYATYGSAQLARHVRAALEGRTAALLSNHGAVLVGAALPALLDRTAYLEYICQVQLLAGAYPAPQRLLDETEIATVAGLLAGYGQTPTRRRDQG